MKRAIIFIIVGAVIGSGAVWLATHGAGHGKPDADEAAAKPAAEEEGKTSLTRDADGNAVVGMSDDMQGDIGIVVKNPVATNVAVEVKAYGRVVDPASLAAFMSEVATAQAAYSVSSNELTRLRTLDAQGNTSARALQAAEATALRDQLAAQSARDKLALSWGPVLAERAASPVFIQSLTSLQRVLVRADVPAGEVLNSPPVGARVVRLSGDSADAEFVCTASGVDSQAQSQGFIFEISANAAHFLSGEAVTAYLKMPGEPLSGAIVPRDAVVRTEGKGWIYVLNENGESFTRREIPLDHGTEDGWFVAKGVTAGQHIVVAGAQVLLSEELKASMSAD